MQTQKKVVDIGAYGGQGDGGITENSEIRLFHLKIIFKSPMVLPST